jgi:uncharacterized membrane protein YkvI
MNNKKGFLATLAKCVSPGFVLMSVLIGGGFATGREIVQYGGQYGARGWIVGLSIALVFSIICMVSFEIARKYKAYDYRSHLKVYAGPLSILYDIIYFVSSLLVMSVMASATGTILETTLNTPYYVGVIVIIVISAIINFFGKKLVEKFSVAGALALYIGYIAFAIMAIAGRTDNIARVFSEADVSYVAEGSTGFFAMIWVGVIYVGYNIQPITTAFFTCEKLHTRKETLLSGFLAGFIILIPWALTYLALMAYYPDESVLGAGVPWLIMMMDVNTIVVVIFGLIAGWTLIATTVGVMNGLTDRIDKQLAEKNKPPMKGTTRVIITLAYLIGAVVMSRFGIIDLVNKGYTAMSYGMIISFAVPLLTVGVYKAFIKKD